MIDDSRCDEKLRLFLFNSRSVIPQFKTENRVEDQNENVNKGDGGDKEDVEMVTTRITQRN